MRKPLTKNPGTNLATMAAGTARSKPSAPIVSASAHSWNQQDCSSQNSQTVIAEGKVKRGLPGLGKESLTPDRVLIGSKPAVLVNPNQEWLISSPLPIVAGARSSLIPKAALPVHPIAVFGTRIASNGSDGSQAQRSHVGDRRPENAISQIRRAAGTLHGSDRHRPCTKQGSVWSWSRSRARPGL